MGLITYVRYARTKLIHDRVSAKAETDESLRLFAERTKLSVEREWRNYRHVAKTSERQNNLKNIKNDLLTPNKKRRLKNH